MLHPTVYISIDGDIPRSPFSPRADLYQICEGSSGGSACALAAYDWLDITISTDTSGNLYTTVWVVVADSVKVPIEYQQLSVAYMVIGSVRSVGLICLAHIYHQPSTDTMPLDRVVRFSEIADTSTFLARSPELFVNYIKAWYVPQFPQQWWHTDSVSA